MTDVRSRPMIDAAIDHLTETIADTVLNDTPHHARMDGLGEQALSLIALIFKREMDRNAEEAAASNMEIKGVN